MHIQPIFLIILLVVKMAQLKHYKKVAPNDLFIGILIVYLLIQSLTSNTKEFHTPGATDNLIDPQAWTNLHTLLRDLYKSGTLTIPGNVHILGDLLVGTYKDENDVLKSFEDSIEHTCVWKPKKNGNNTTGMGWMKDNNIGGTKNAAWKRNSKPATGGGVFSFRAGHMDLHPVFISRKQPRRDNTGTTAKANTVILGDYRLWNPTVPDGIHFAAAHEYVAADGNPAEKQSIQTINYVRAHQVHGGEVRTDTIASAEGGTGWIRCHSNFVIQSGKALQMDSGTHLEVKGSMRMTKIKQMGTNKVAELGAQFPGWQGYVFEHTDDTLKLSD